MCCCMAANPLMKLSTAWRRCATHLVPHTLVGTTHFIPCARNEDFRFDLDGVKRKKYNTLKPAFSGALRTRQKCPLSGCPLIWEV